MARRALRTIAPATLALCAAGCYFPATPSSGPLFVYEQEPNDYPELANWVAYAYPGQDFVVEGGLWGPDPQDGFAFVAAEPCEVDLVLTTHDPGAAFGVCLYDPATGLMPFCFASGANPQLGGFDVWVWDWDFHLVVVPLWGSAEYTLSVSVSPLGPAPEADAPGPPAPATPRAGTPPADPAFLERAQRYARPRAADRAARVEPALRRAGELVVVRPDGSVTVGEVWSR